jgi:hypothetical protein
MKRKEETREEKSDTETDISVIWNGEGEKEVGTAPVEIPRWFSGLYISIPRSYNKPLLAKAFCALAAAVSPFRIRYSAGY